MPTNFIKQFYLLQNQSMKHMSNVKNDLNLQKLTRQNFFYFDSLKCLLMKCFFKPYAYAYWFFIYFDTFISISNDDKKQFLIFKCLLIPKFCLTSICPIFIIRKQADFWHCDFSSSCFCVHKIFNLSYLFKFTKPKSKRQCFSTVLLYLKVSVTGSSRSQNQRK